MKHIRSEQHKFIIDCIRSNHGKAYSAPWKPNVITRPRLAFPNHSKSCSWEGLHRDFQLDGNSAYLEDQRKECGEIRKRCGILALFIWPCAKAYSRLWALWHGNQVSCDNQATCRKHWISLNLWQLCCPKPAFGPQAAYILYNNSGILWLSFEVHATWRGPSWVAMRLPRWTRHQLQ